MEVSKWELSKFRCDQGRRVPRRRRGLLHWSPELWSPWEHMGTWYTARFAPSWAPFLTLNSLSSQKRAQIHCRTRVLGNRYIYTITYSVDLTYDDRSREVKSWLEDYYWNPQTRSMAPQDRRNHWSKASSVVDRRQVCCTTLLSIVLGHLHLGTSSLHSLRLLPDLARSWGRTVDAFFQFAVATGMSWLAVVSFKTFNSIYVF